MIPSNSRLYSSAVFNDSFSLYTTPEIQRKPVDDLVLQMKAMSIHKVVNFPFPSAPDLTQLKVAEKRLRLLGALTLSSGSGEGKSIFLGLTFVRAFLHVFLDCDYLIIFFTLPDDFSGKLTSLGQAISVFPVSPRFGKMLALSHQHDLLGLTVCLVAALSVQEVLIEVPNSSKGMKDPQPLWSQIQRKWAGVGNSKLLGTVSFVYLLQIVLVLPSIALC